MPLGDPKVVVGWSSRIFHDVFLMAIVMTLDLESGVYIRHVDWPTTSYGIIIAP